MSCGQDAAVILAAPGHVEQAKQNALRADADGVVEISGNAFSHKDGCDVSALDLGKYGRDGLDGRCDIRDAGVKERTHGEQAPSETSTGTGSGQTVRSRSRVGVRIHLSVSWPFSSSSRQFAIMQMSSRRHPKHGQQPPMLSPASTRAAVFAYAFWHDLPAGEQFARLHAKESTGSLSLLNSPTKVRFACERGEQGKDDGRSA